MFTHGKSTDFPRISRFSMENRWIFLTFSKHFLKFKKNRFPNFFHHFTSSQIFLSTKLEQTINLLDTYRDTVTSFWWSREHYLVASVCLVQVAGKFLEFSRKMRQWVLTLKEMKFSLLHLMCMSTHSIFVTGIHTCCRVSFTCIEKAIECRDGSITWLTLFARMTNEVWFKFTTL